MALPLAILLSLIIGGVIGGVTVLLARLDRERQSSAKITLAASLGGALLGGLGVALPRLADGNPIAIGGAAVLFAMCGALVAELLGANQDLDEFRDTSLEIPKKSHFLETRIMDITETRKRLEEE